MLDASRSRPHWSVAYAMAIAVAVALGVLAGWSAVVLDLPLRDPDGLLGPSWVRLPVVVAVVLALDVLPRVLVSRRAAGGVRPALTAVMQTRWPLQRLVGVLVGLACFYVTYVAYRNLKSFLPFVRGDRVDVELIRLDRWFTGGESPAVLLHDWLGTGLAAHALSGVYLAFLTFVPLSLAVALVWNDDLARGSWYVTALCWNWALGTLSYYLLPSVGPIYAQPWLFTDLPSTGTAALQEGLLRSRQLVLADPHATERVHGIAAFASLHVSIVFTAALVATLIGLPRAVRIVMWVFFVLTVVATVYFGWHYLVDDVAGVAIGAVSVWLAAVGTGHRDWLRRRRAVVPSPRREPAAVGAGAVSAPTGAGSHEA